MSVFSNMQVMNSYWSCYFVSQDYFCEFDLDIDNVSCFQCVQVYNIVFYFSQVRQMNFGCNCCFMRSEVEFWQMMVQRYLIIFEIVMYVIVRMRFLIFVIMIIGFIEVRIDIMIQVFICFFGVFGWRQSI